MPRGIYVRKKKHVFLRSQQPSSKQEKQQPVIDDKSLVDMLEDSKESIHIYPKRYQDDDIVVRCASGYIGRGTSLRDALNNLFAKG